MCSDRAARLPCYKDRAVQLQTCFTVPEETARDNEKVQPNLEQHGSAITFRSLSGLLPPGQLLKECNKSDLLVCVALALDLGNISVTFHELLETRLLRLNVHGNTPDDVFLLLTLCLE